VENLFRKALGLIRDMLMSEYGFSDVSTEPEVGDDESVTKLVDDSGIEIVLRVDEEAEAVVVTIETLTCSQNKNVVDLIEGLKIDLEIGPDGTMDCYEEHEIENLLVDERGEEKYEELTDSQKTQAQQEIPRFCKVIFHK